MSVVPKLTYFNVRGRAEPIRMLLADNKVSFENVGIPMQDWYTQQASLPLDFAQVPLYEEEDVQIVQTHAILRYLARKYKCYGTNEQEQIRCDMAQEAYAECLTELLTLYWDKECLTKKQSFLDEKLKKRLAMVAAFFAKNGNANYFVGNHVTFVDYCFWNYLDCVRAMPEFMQALRKDFAGLAKFYDEFTMVRPEVANYLQSKDRFKTITVAIATYGGSEETS